MVDTDTKGLYIAGEGTEIATLFQRIERFVTRLTGGQNVLKFEK